MQELQILILEDAPQDVVLINRELRKAQLSFRSQRVESKEAFLAELQVRPPDLILSDHGVPGFDGFMALAIARDRCPDNRLSRFSSVPPRRLTRNRIGSEAGLNRWGGPVTPFSPLIFRESTHLLSSSIEVG